MINLNLLAEALLLSQFLHHIEEGSLLRSSSTDSTLTFTVTRDNDDDTDWCVCSSSFYIVNNSSFCLSRLDEARFSVTTNKAAP